MPPALPKVKIWVKMSAKGQMVIPAQLRSRLGLRPGTIVSVELAEDGSSLNLRPDWQADPMSMRGMLANVPGDPLRELEEDRKREIARDRRMVERLQRA